MLEAGARRLLGLALVLPWACRGTLEFSPRQSSRVQSDGLDLPARPGMMLLEASAVPRAPWSSPVGEGGSSSTWEDSIT